MPELYLIRNTLRDLIRLRKVAVGLLLAALPAVIVFVTRWKMGGDYSPLETYNTMTSRAVIGIVLVLVSLVAGTGVITQENEQRTIVYLLTRPVARWRILLAKFVPALGASILVAWISLGLVGLVALAGTRTPDAPIGRDFLVTALGAVVYGTLFLFLATVSERPLIPGLLYAFGWETWVGMLPGHFQKLSLMAYLQVLAPHTVPEGESVSFNAILGAFSPETISPLLARIVLTAVTLGALTLALIVFSNREYVPKDETV